LTKLAGSAVDARTCRDRAEPRLMRRLVTVASAALLACGVGTGTAAAASWTIQPTPSLGTDLGDLTSVSCPSSTTCTAVGFSFSSGDDPSTRVPLVERWNGVGWEIQPTPPTRGGNGELLGLSCTSAAACTAVGDFENRAGDTLPLAERWNGISWSIQRVPRPFSEGTRDEATLYAVSCTSRSGCTAVGSDDDADQPLAEHSNGSKWSIEQTRSPGVDGGELFGVSCRTTRMCTAVGSFYEASTNCWAPLVERSNHGRWSIKRAADLRGCGSPNDASFTGVSCPFRSSCTAVGNYARPGGAYNQPLAERESARGWSFQPTPPVTYRVDPWGGGGFLDDVACSSRAACIAVGAAGSELKAVPIVELWTGRRWTLHAAAKGIRDGEFLAISCTAKTTCTAVGANDSAASGSDEPLVERLS
jgi:hypothetical protein